MLAVNLPSLKKAKIHNQTVREETFLRRTLPKWCSEDPFFFDCFRVWLLLIGQHCFNIDSGKSLNHVYFKQKTCKNLLL